jgi:hypothetical protein
MILSHPGLPALPLSPGPSCNSSLYFIGFHETFIRILCNLSREALNIHRPHASALLSTLCQAQCLLYTPPLPISFFPQNITEE